MKTIKTFILLFFTLQFSAQNADTINVVDINGKKQGHWIILGKDKPKSCFKLNDKIEEGYYVDNRKNGVWTEYYCNGFTKNHLTFKAGRPDGLQELYYENGQIQEVGFWKKNKWEGVHKKYTIDGKQQQDSSKVYKKK
jgi:antitoxin component YwqK of YwqJK toxin-antitoxin module